MSHQLKQTIQQLNDEIEHVKKLESLRKDFINQFTHEMKTPLGIINGYGELIEEAESDEEREKYIAIIHRETKTYQSADSVNVKFVSSRSRKSRDEY